MAQKGSEYALCLNSFNRDTDAFPEPNDFDLELLDRYDFQMVVLGSLELPFNQWTVEEGWSRFSYDVGLSYHSRASRSLHLLEPDIGATVLLPAPFTPVRRLRPRVYQTVDAQDQPQPHGLSEGALGAFSPQALRVATRDDTLAVRAVLSATELQVMRDGEAVGLLLVAEANSRTFNGPDMLCAVLNANCRWQGVPLRFDYSKSKLELALQPTGRCSLQQEADSLLDALGFCLPSQARYDVAPLVTRFPRALGRLGAALYNVQIPPAQYDATHLQRITEHQMNNRAFLEVPPPAAADTITVATWGRSEVDQVRVELSEPFISFHPTPIAQLLTRSFASAQTQLLFSYEQDCIVIRPQVPGTIFKILWPDGGSQVINFRLRLPEPSFGTKVQGVTLHYVADAPTAISLPSTFRWTQIAASKRYVLVPRPKLQPGGAVHLTGLRLLAPAERLSALLPLGCLPLETPLVFRSGDSSCYALVVQHEEEGTRVQLLSDRPVTPDWEGTVVPLMGGAVNLYFQTQSCLWNRLAEIFGFPSGASLCDEGALMAPYQHNLEPPSYVLLDLGLQHSSATISHRCGSNVMTQFFGKIVLMPPYAERRMTPIQAISSGVSVASRLHLRILNPWHQLYEFHGRNWSMTIIMATNTKAARTDCL